MHKVTTELPPQTVQQKTSAALFIAVHGAEATGIRTKAQLMWPHKEFTDQQAAKEAASFLGNVHIALLEALPPQCLDRILKDQDERLSFVL